MGGKFFSNTFRSDCSIISIMSKRRLKLRSNERISERPSIRLVFARPDYDCRQNVARRSQKGAAWKAIFGPLQNQINRVFGGM